MFTVSDRPVTCVAATDTINSIIAVGDRGGSVTIYSIKDWSITGTVADTDGASVTDVSIYRMTSSLDLLIAVRLIEYYYFLFIIIVLRYSVLKIEIISLIYGILINWMRY